VNNRKQASCDDLHELAVLHALGSLEGPDKVAFEEHLRQGCEVCASEVLSFGETAGLIESLSRLLLRGTYVSDCYQELAAVPAFPEFFSNTVES